MKNYLIKIQFDCNNADYVYGLRIVSEDEMEVINNNLETEVTFGNYDWNGGVGDPLKDSISIQELTEEEFKVLKKLNLEEFGERLYVEDLPENGHKEEEIFEVDSLKYKTLDYDTVELTDDNNIESLVDVTIPETVEHNSKKYSITSIVDYAFYGCSSLTKIICKIRNPLEIHPSVFRAVNENCTLYVPAESVELYKNAEVWNKLYIKSINQIK